MPWVETNVREQRLQCVIAALRPGANKAAVFRAFGVSRKTGDKWLARHQEAGILGLADRSRRPHHSPTRTDDDTAARVREARAVFGWGGEKLAVVLRAQGLAVSARTVDRIIQREGLTRRDAGPGPALRRFEHAAPNDLWQLDAKGYYPLTPSGRCHPLTVLDDHSRFVVALEALPTLTRAVVQPALIRCFEQYGLPDALLMDHGTPGGTPGMRPG
jgi:transposase